MASNGSRPAVHSLLLPWYRRLKRDLPWRRTRDPYRIWVSEIMLQQTRVETVIPYYERFLKRYPTIGALAAAPEAELLEAWSGLGYYRRARQMLAAAQRLTESGGFPEEYEAIRELPGIGDYTAAAVASIAFEAPRAAVDGNVLRVVSRVTDDGRDIGRASTRKAFGAAAQGWMDAVEEGDRGDFNQALMELGATVCTPRSPKCLICPLCTTCLSFRRGTQSERPVKKTAEKLRRVELSVAVVAHGGSLWMRPRPADAAVMPGFWELPQVEGPAGGLNDLGLAVGEQVGEFKHCITVTSFQGRVYRAAVDGRREDGYRWVTARRRAGLPVTTITKKALAAFETATQAGNRGSGRED